MSKFKKVFLIVLLSVLTIAVAVDTYIKCVTLPYLSEMHAKPDPSFNKTYYKMDDVEYIRNDVARPNAQKIENGEVDFYNLDDINDALDEAAKRRDERNAAESSAE